METTSSRPTPAPGTVGSRSRDRRTSSGSSTRSAALASTAASIASRKPRAAARRSSGIIAERGGNLGSTTARLLQLLDAAGAAELEDALVEALERDTIHVGAVRQIVDRRRSAAETAAPGSIPITRGEHADLVVTPHALASYDALKKEESP